MAVLGATGILGKQLLEALEAKGLPSESLTLLASERSEGEEVSYGGDSLWIERMGPTALKGIDLALLALPRGVAAQAVLWAEQAGIGVMDFSGGSPPQIPLLSPHALGKEGPQWPSGKPQVSLASPLAQVLACMLFPLKPFGRIEATALCGAACLGQAGVRALEKQTLALLNGREPEVEGGHRQAFNLLPAFEGEAGGGGFAHPAEAEVPMELERLLGGPVALGLHVFFAPFFFGVSMSFSVAIEGGRGLEHWREALASGYGIKILEDKEHGLYPMPLLISQDSSLLVGKLRLQDNILRGVLAFEPALWVAEFAANLAMVGVGA